MNGPRPMPPPFPSRRADTVETKVCVEGPPYVSETRSAGRVGARDFGRPYPDPEATVMSRKYRCGRSRIHPFN